MMIFTAVIKCYGKSILPIDNCFGLPGMPESGPGSLLGKSHPFQMDEYEGNNLFSDIELSRYFCSVF